MKKIVLFGLCTIFGLFFSCKKDETIPRVESPTLDILEVGYDNSKIAYTNHDLHIEATILSPGKIAWIKLQITFARTDIAWDFVETYKTGYSGLKNVVFHEHIDVPENAREGEYELLILVEDELGNKSSTKTTFEVKKDLSLPQISDASLKILSTDRINFSGQVNAVNQIEKLNIEVQSSAWTRNFLFEDSAMVGQTSFPFEEEIDISESPAGHYHVNITLFDKAGKTARYGYHFDK